MKFVTAQDEEGVFVGIIEEGEKRVLPLNRRENDLPETLEECIATSGFFEQAISIYQQAKALLMNSLST